MAHGSTQAAGDNVACSQQGGHWAGSVPERYIGGEVLREAVSDFIKNIFVELSIPAFLDQYWVDDGVLDMERRDTLVTSFPSMAVWGRGI